MKTHRWMSWCVTIVCFALSLGIARAESDQQLVNTFDEAEAAGKYAVALEAALSIVQRHPEASFWMFNAARMCARTGQIEKALELLSQSADKGFAGINSLEQHADLEAIRKMPQYPAIAAKVRANAQKRFDAFKAEALAHKPQVYVPKSAPKDRKPAVMIALHGSGGVGGQMASALRKTCDQLGMICIAPDALRQDGNGYSWTYRDEAEWMVQHMIELAVKEYNADPDQVYLVGFSQGANIALVMTQSHADLFAGVIPVCGHYEANVTPDSKKVASTYLITGARDPWKETYEQAKEDFAATGARAEIRVVPGMGHEMASTAEMVRAMAWFSAAGEDTK